MLESWLGDKGKSTSSVKKMGLEKSWNLLKNPGT
jgi:hypothetical protein